jgi:hypothetical protein
MLQPINYRSRHSQVWTKNSEFFSKLSLDLTEIKSLGESSESESGSSDRELENEES